MRRAPAAGQNAEALNNNSNQVKAFLKERSKEKGGLVLWLVSASEF